MEVYRTKHEISVRIKALKTQNKRIGFVATMGALHNGHLALVKSALLDNDIVAVSVFVLGLYE